MELIDKSALVAEIEKLKADTLQKKSQCKRKGLERIMHQIGAYNKVISLINTIEVKDVDLNDEKCKDLNDDGTCIFATNRTGKVMRCEYINCSRKIKAQKGK